MVENPLVSISILTYNQRHYICDAIDSALMQVVNFPYEIIVGDDCSDDGTQEILKAYQAKHPDKISLILHPRRYNEIPGRTNNLTNLYNCRGKYIAMLDGDDYWTDKHKLQTQVDFLEQNPAFIGAFHDIKTVFVDDERESFFSSDKNTVVHHRDVLTYKDIADANFMPISSLVFRNVLDEELPEWFREVSSADFFLMLILGLSGEFKNFNNVMGIRHKNRHSFTDTFLKTLKGQKIRVQEHEILAKHFPALKGNTNLKNRLAKAYWNIAKHHFSENNFLAGLLYLFKYGTTPSELSLLTGYLKRKLNL